MKIVILLILVNLLCSCKNKEPEKSETSTITKDVNTLTEINFNLNNFTKIKNYKKINFKAPGYIFDKYLLETDSVTYYSCFSEKPKIDDLNQSSNSFTLKTKTARITFNSIDNDGEYLNYQYSNNLKSLNYHIVTANTIDSRRTIFLGDQKFEGFTTSGTVVFSNNKQYFISFSAEPDYCILEFYKIENNSITNIINLYTIENPIDEICWNKKIVYKEVSIHGEKNKYYELDINRILLDYDR